MPVALHPDLFQTAAADCYAAAQNAEDLAIKQAYLELTQGWRALADEAVRLRSRPTVGMSLLLQATIAPQRRLHEKVLQSKPTSRLHALSFRRPRA